MTEILQADISYKKHIKNVYLKVYGNFYSLPEVQEDDLMQQILENNNNLWIVAKKGNEVIGSLLFRVDGNLSLAKGMAAIVLPEYRNQGIFKEMFEFGLNRLNVDIIYALTRTISPEPQKLLLKYNFLPLGLFPNVRRIYAYENHGLYALIKQEAFSNRKSINKVLKEIADLLGILKDIVISRYLLKIFKNKFIDLRFLEQFISEKYDILEREKFNFNLREAKKLDIKVLNVEKEYLEVIDKLRFKFFPFHRPNFKITTEFGSFFLHINMIDKHSAIMGIDVPEDDLEKMYNLFFNIPYIVDKLDARYLEVISMAINHRNHSILLDNGFIPAAYFPCLIPYQDGRVDAVIFFYPYNLPHFKKMYIPEEFKNYIKYVYSMIVKKINQEVEYSLR